MDILPGRNCAIARIRDSYQLDGFFKAHDVWIDYTVEDPERERTSLQRLGF